MIRKDYKNKKAFPAVKTDGISGNILKVKNYKNLSVRFKTI